nr:metallophosphoesterase [uncultured Dyadobacter sp.]
MQLLLTSVLVLWHALPVLLRGPYLQSATSHSIVIRWRTDVPTDSRVSFGMQPGALTNTVDSTALVTDHEVLLTGLAPHAKYFYSIGSSQLLLQGDAGNYFKTAPPPGMSGKYRIGVLGDCGNNSVNQANTRDKLLDYCGDEYMDAWILLGDNAYMNGTDAEYQSNFFNVYKDRFLKQLPLYPCPGNHEYANSGTKQLDHKIPYFDIFTIPTGGQAGGVPSGTESFYSFDYGNIHFLALDSYGKEADATRLYDTLGKQVQWIKQDLAVNANKDWIVAYWHHPPYTKGSHDSDTETELVKIREKFIRILERSGVDVILCGHSHDYERSKLMNGHYDSEAAFNAGVHNISNSSGKYDGSADSCPYVKSTIGNKGTVYVVAGSAGQLGATQSGYPHNALPFATASTGGALLLDVDRNRLDMKWITSGGNVLDRFTIVKDVNRKDSVQIEKGQSITLEASYPGNYIWNTGATTGIIDVSPAVTTEYVVQDGLDCLSDTTKVIVVNPLPVRFSHFSGSFQNGRTLLTWRTTQETKAAYFVIERSWDGRHFTPIGKVAASGESDTERIYWFSDEDLSHQSFGKNGYYRLKEVDLDGRWQFSDIIVVKLPDREGNEVIVRPNPSGNQEVSVHITGSLGEYDLVLTNQRGQVVLKRHFVPSNAPHSFSLGRLPPGTYILTAAFVKHKVVRTIIVN